MICTHDVESNQGITIKPIIYIMLNKDNILLIASIHLALPYPIYATTDVSLSPSNSYPELYLK